LDPWSLGALQHYSPSTSSFYSLRPFEAMGTSELLAVCSSAGCGRLFCCLGLLDPEGGNLCGVCEAYQTQALVICKHAAQFNLLASGRSTSHLLKLVRNDYLLHRLADVAVGTLESAMQIYLLRLQRATWRLILAGRPHGFRPVFLRLDRVWIRPFRTEQDCLDLVLDFLGEYACALW
jgi:hypothetical protein